MDDGELRKADYQKKKHQHDKHKKVKETLSEQEQYAVELISSMSAKALLDFIEDKYDKLVTKNQKLLSPINNQVIKRIPELRKEFVQSNYEKINKYIAKHTNRELTKEEMERVKKQKWGTRTFETKPQTMTKTNFSNTINAQVLVVMISPNEKDMKVEHFYMDNKEEAIFFQISFKRMKKQAVEILENFINLEMQVNTLKYSG